MVDKDGVIELPVYGIVINTTHEGGAIAANLHDFCTHCYSKDCFNDDCLYPNAPRIEVDPEDVESRRSFNGAMDGITSLLLAHAIAGVDVKADAYIEGLKTAVEACGNNM